MCRKASEEGKYDARRCTGVFSLSRKAAIGLPKQVFENGLKHLGFGDYRLSPDTYPCTGIGPYRFVIWVSWKNVSRDALSEAEPPKKRLKGHIQTCQVCEEKKSLVVLAPCGHVMCQDCRNEQTLKQSARCPFCRQHVLCVTDGLFLGWTLLSDKARICGPITQINQFQCNLSILMLCPQIF